jgi:hypothetical protein
MKRSSGWFAEERKIGVVAEAMCFSFLAVNEALKGLSCLHSLRFSSWSSIFDRVDR